MTITNSTTPFETAADLRALMMAVTARLLKQGDYSAALLAGRAVIKAGTIKRRFDELTQEHQAVPALELLAMPA